MDIKFNPKFQDEDLIKAAKEYQNIWDENGKRIVEEIEKYSKLKFETDKIDAIVFEGISKSHPLHLKASNPFDYKKGDLIHELCHILLVDNDIKANSSVEAHIKLNPILYKVWVKLYGKDFADKMVNVEKNRREVYKKAWEALNK